MLKKCLAVFIFSFFCVFLLKSQALAAGNGTPIYSNNPPPANYQPCGNNQCLNAVCWNSEAIGVSSCGTACQPGEGGSTWTKYSCSGTYTDTVDPLDNCHNWFSRSDDVCSTGDKYNSSNPPVMNAGFCSCAVGGPYKTCCNGTTQVGARAFPVDPYYPNEADCNIGGATEVRCGGVGEPTCGQAACDSLITPTTPTPTPCPNGSCSPGSTQCLGTGKQTCESTINGWCWSAPFCPVGQTCNPTNKECIPNTCPNDKAPCTQEGSVMCVPILGGEAYAICKLQPSANDPNINVLCYDITKTLNIRSCPSGKVCSRSTIPNECIPSGGGGCNPPCTSNQTCSNGICVDNAPPPIVTFPPGCFIWQSCNVPGGWQTILIWPIILVQQNWCPLGSDCIQQPGSGTSCTNQQCVDRGPVTISGNIFTDYNANRIKDPAEPTSSCTYNISATYFSAPGVTPAPTPAPTVGPGCYGGYLSACLYNCGLAGYNCPNGGNNYCPSACAPLPTPIPTPIPTPAPVAVNQSGSSYSIASSLYGTYTVTASTTCGTFTEPAGGSFSVIAGNQQVCSTGGSANASCYLGGIKNLHFGVKGNNPWIQSIGADIRQDSGFSQQIPANASCGSYASLPGAGGSPGIIYSGGSTSSFGSGQASSTNWVAGGATYPSNYTPARPNLIRTSYNYLFSVAKLAAITPIDIGIYCAGGLNDCTLPSNLPNGLYISNGSLTLSSTTYTFPANKNFVILVNGNLNLKGKILVPSGSTATFSSSADITVDRGVGQASVSSTNSDVEGFYSADKNFIADGNNNCGIGTDLRLNIAGAIVVNAALSGGTFQNNRNLCGGNDNCPAFSVKERPDFVLNAPEFIKHPSYIWQELAP